MSEQELTDEQIEEQMEQAALGNEPDEPTVAEVTEEVEPEPEPEVAVEEETTPAEAVSEEPTESVKEPEGETVTEPEEDIDAEINDSRLKSLESEKDLWRSRANRDTSRMDFLERRLAELGHAPAPQEDTEYRESEVTEPEPRPAPPVTRPSEKVTSWAISRAMQDAGSQFAASHPDVSDMGDQIKEYLETVKFNPESLLLHDDPGHVQREVTTVLQEAYHHVTSQRESARLVVLKQRKADQTQKLAKAKQNASASASTSTPAPKPKEINSPDDMSDDELDKAMLEATEGRW